MQKRLLITGIGVFLCHQTASAGFYDVPSNYIYHTAITSLESKAILKGKGANRFDPSGYITRAEFLKVLFEATNTQLQNKPKKRFQDVDYNHWSGQYIATANNIGILNGHPNGNAYPNKPINQLEALKLVNVIQGKDYNDQETWRDAFPEIVSQYPRYSASPWMRRGQSAQLIYNNFITHEAKEAAQLQHMSFGGTTVTQDTKNVLIWKGKVNNITSNTIYLENLKIPLDTTGIESISVIKDMHGEFAKDARILASDIHEDRLEIYFIDEKITRGKEGTIEIYAHIKPEATSNIIKIDTIHASFLDSNSKEYKLTEKVASVDYYDIPEIKIQKVQPHNISYTPKNEDVAIAGEEIYLGQFSLTAPEDTNLEGIELILSYDNYFTENIIRKIAIIDSNGTQLDAIYNIPTNQNAIWFNDAKPKLLKNAENIYYIVAETEKIADGGVQSGNTFKVEARSIRGFTAKTGAKANNRVAIRNNSNPLFMYTGSYPVITTAPNSPTTIANGNNKLFSIKVQNPSTHNNIGLQALSFEMDINDGKTKNLEIDNFALHKNGQKITECSDSNNKIYCNLNTTAASSIGLEDQIFNSAKDGLFIRANQYATLDLVADISNFEINSDAITIKIPQNQSLSVDTDQFNAGGTVKLQSTDFVLNSNAGSVIYKDIAGNKNLLFTPIEEYTIKSNLLRGF